MNGTNKRLPASLGCHNVAMLTDMSVVMLLSMLILVTALCDFAAARTVPLPRPRRAEGATSQSPKAATPGEPAPPSACRLRLTSDLALAPSLPSIDGPDECGADDVVRLDAVVLPNKNRIAVIPPAILRCTLAEASVQWVREDVAPAARSLEAALKSLDNYPSYDSPGRNRIAGAKLSEHGKANARDIRSLKLANGTVGELTQPHVSKHFRYSSRRSTC